MGNRSSNNENNQALLRGNQSQVNDADISLMINNQHQVKQIYAIKNPFLLKRNSLTLERDSNQRGLYYVQFFYDSLVDLDVVFYFNAKWGGVNGKEVKLGKDSEGEMLNSNKNDKKITNDRLYYIPSQNFLNNGKIVKFPNCPKGQGKKFFETRGSIFMPEYNELKKDEDDMYDLVIEFKIASSKSSNSNDVCFYTLCRFTSDGNNANNGNETKIKTEMQRLKSHSMWFDIQEIFNSALESGECLICCSAPHNTIFLPCNHTCTCQTCAHSLRMRNNPCPICKISKFLF